MSANFDVVGRAQVAGYASAATGILRSRIHPLVPVAAIDVLAVALALGAMNIVGTMVGGHRENPFLAAIDRTKDDFTTFAVKTAAVPQAAPAIVEVLAALPDTELLFAPPVIIGGPFEAGQGDTVRFISSGDVDASNDEPPTTSNPQPTDVAAVDELPVADPGVTAGDAVSPPLAKILSIAGRSQARALELANSTIGPAINLGGASVEAIATTKASAAVPVAETAAATVSAAVAAPVQTVAAPVQQVVQSVTQPVTQVVGGLLN